MDEIPASDIGEPPAWHDWSTNELILDEIFRFLDPPDLKNARLVIRKWAVCGSRPLARKTFIRVSQVAPAVFYWNRDKLLLPHFRDHFMNGQFNRQQGFRLHQELNGGGPSPEFDFDLWECSSDLKPREYLTFSAYSRCMDSAVFSSEFEPRNFVVYTFFDMIKLRSLELSNVERLQVVFIKPSEMYALLSKVHRLFPSLKSLELCYFETVEDSTSVFVLDWIPEYTARQPLVKNGERLEELSFPVPADLIHLDWSFLAQFGSLKNLKIRWPGSFSITWPEPPERGSLKGIRNSDYVLSGNFGDWLQATGGYLNLPKLTDLNLRFSVTPNNIVQVKSALTAATNLNSAALEVYGRCEAVFDFISQLDLKTMAVLNSLHLSCESSLGCVFCCIEANIIVRLLSEKGFFRKPTWTLIIRDAEGTFWIHMEKYETQCIVQTQGNSNFQMFTPSAQLPYIFEAYNYSYSFNIGSGSTIQPVQQFTSEFVYPLPSEKSNSAELLELLDNSPTGTTFGQFRQKPQMLLCDFAGFRQEAGLRLGKRSMDKGFFTMGYSFVPLPVTAKWSKHLQKEQLNYELQQLEAQNSAHNLAFLNIAVRQAEVLELLLSGVKEEKRLVEEQSENAGNQ